MPRHPAPSFHGGCSPFLEKDEREKCGFSKNIRAEHKFMAQR